MSFCQNASASSLPSFPLFFKSFLATKTKALFLLSSRPRRLRERRRGRSDFCAFEIVTDFFPRAAESEASVRDTSRRGEVRPFEEFDLLVFGKAEFVFVFVHRVVITCRVIPVAIFPASFLTKPKACPHQSLGFRGNVNFVVTISSEGEPSLSLFLLPSLFLFFFSFFDDFFFFLFPSSSSSSFFLISSSTFLSLLASLSFLGRLNRDSAHFFQAAQTLLA